MKPIDMAGFEAMFRTSIDPWNYKTSPFEAFKRRVLLRACGDRIHGRGLELACAIGETSRVLAPRCLRLLAVDSSQTALAEARRRSKHLPGVVFRRAALPAEMPRGPFDLIVVSEIAYYLRERDLKKLTDRIFAALAPGGRVVVLHHTCFFDDAMQPPAIAQGRLKRSLAARYRLRFREQHRQFEAVAFEKPVAPIR